MNHSESIKELAAALAKAQGAMNAAKMDAVNPFLKNHYADLGSVILAARQPMSANGLSFTQMPSISEGAVTVTTLLLHSSGEWIESAITLPLGESRGLSLAQSMGAIITYLRRYSLSAILGIYADEDTDGNESNKAAAKPNGAKPEQPSPRPAEVVVAELYGEPAPRPNKITDLTPQPEIAQAWKADVLTALAGAYELTMPRLTSTLKYCNLPKSSTLKELTGWMEVYKAHRASGEEPAIAANSANEQANH